MFMPLDEQSAIVIQRLRGARYRDLFELDEAAQGLSDFNVEQMGRVQTLVRLQCDCSNRFRPVRAEQELQQRGGINDNQRRSRSERTTSVGETLPR